MKRGIALLMAICMLVLAGGCSNPGETTASQDPTPASTPSPAASQPPSQASAPSPEATIAPNTFKVGWSIDTITSDFNAAADKRIKMDIGLMYPEIELFSAEANAQAMKQVSDVEDLIAKGVDLLLVKPKDEATLATTLQQARAQGIKVILFDRYVQGDPYDVFVGCDDVEIGRILGKGIAEALGGKGNVVLCEGTAGASSYMDRIEGFKAALEEYPDVKILASQPSTAKREDGKAIMENWIQAHGDKINAAVALTDATTMGIIQAIDESGLKNIVVGSVNGSMEALKAVVDGKIHVEVAVSSSVIPALPIMWEMLNGNMNFPQKIISPPFVVTPDNAMDYYDETLFRFDEYEPKTNPLVQGCIDKYPELKNIEIRGHS